MRSLIDLYNEMLVEVADEVPHVHYVKIPGTLSHQPADYREYWRDELHPTDDGFLLVANEFDEVIRDVT